MCRNRPEGRGAKGLHGAHPMSGEVAGEAEAAGGGPEVQPMPAPWERGGKPEMWIDTLTPPPGG